MKILWIVFVWPEPRSSAAGFRTLELMENARGAGYEVVVSSPCQPNEYKEALTKGGFETVRFEANDSHFDEYLRALNPDIVVFDRFVIEEQFGWRVKEQLPETLRILDTIDLHSLRRVRQNKISNGDDSPISSVDLATVDIFRELASILRCDHSLVISDFESQFLHERFNVASDLVSVCRYSVERLPKVSTFAERKHLVMIGNFNHAPNLDAVTILHREIWPQLKARFSKSGISDIELHIYGAYPPASVLQLDNARTGFRVRGRTQDAKKSLGAYRINLAPLRFGAGIKGKVSDGWAAGTPCVGTTIAGEGMHGTMPFGGSIVDSWSTFCDECISLYTDEDKWKEQQTNGFTVLQSLYSPDENKKIFLESLSCAVEQKPQRRANNFFGAMLWHHQFRATEFFSRWIEAKNK